MTGHSKKIATKISKELNIEAQNIKLKPELKEVDLLFIVGGIYSGKSLPDMLNYIKTLNTDAVKKVVLITSSAQEKKGQDEVRSILTSNKIEVAPEEYRCKGNFLFLRMGHPNKAEIECAISFTKDIISQEKVKLLE